MSIGRSIQGDSPCAYRVVKEYFGGQQQHYGPYSTLGAAKGKRTNLTNDYGNSVSNDRIWIEKTPDGWEKVDV